MEGPSSSRDLLLAAARNCGEAYAFPTGRMGRPTLTTDAVVAGDLGFPFAVPPNSATLLRPSSPEEQPGLVTELRSVFGGPGGGWSVWDLWGSVDLLAEGFETHRMPCMIRDVGGVEPPLPVGLRIVEVADARTRIEMEDVILRGYGIPVVQAGDVWSDDVFGDPAYRAWVGYADGVPVTTATAYVGAGMVGVYVVATVPEARGRGFGEAATWVATMSRPDLPATLQATDMGRPIYERMGYRTIADFTVWSTDTRG